ncbi:hypothetical protein PVAP13_6KG178401 [Panicum virgatum]|uniref:Disease resistance R13L4/SHOC-2-like LRR domain-containing protein n=1 Tax=Panicum virgatum TaxID=38727 RepID=A0A8T0RHA5_PANVG|nr:hypothetical protein PVAP13_6KG178401 [Panicum virgatum]
MYFMELIEGSMILPSQLSVNSLKGIDSGQVHDLMREIGISKSIEENLVFRMEEGCSSNTSGIVRHLVISTNWEGDKSEFESAVDLSRIRSLTVFGKWRSFFISKKMRFLRVLDLEGTSSGLVDHHLEHIGRLRHLRYLSLRRCNTIFHLPDSIGNLTQLQALDLASTKIWKLPKTITKLRKLQYLRVTGPGNSDNDMQEQMFEILPKVSRNWSCFHFLMLLGFCVVCCAPQILDENFNRRDVWCLHVFLVRCVPCIDEHAAFNSHAKRDQETKIPAYIGFCKYCCQQGNPRGLKNACPVTEVSCDWHQQGKWPGVLFCSVVANLNCLESLLVQSNGIPGLRGCLDGLTAAPKNLQSLRLYGNLVELPGWVGELQNLVKLRLRSSRILEHQTALQVLGKLPNLVSLCLWSESFQGEDLHFTFHPEAFPSLMVLELNGIVLTAKIGIRHYRPV